MSEPIKVLAPAKINLGLTVKRKREDGYHEIKTLFQAVNLYDELTVTLKDRGIELICEGSVLPSDERNIVWQAANMFLSHYNLKMGVRILLKKKYLYPQD